MLRKEQQLLKDNLLINAAELIQDRYFENTLASKLKSKGMLLWRRDSTFVSTENERLWIYSELRKIIFDQGRPPEKSLFSSENFLIELIRVLMSNFLSSLYILEIRPLSDVGLVKIVSQSVACLFVLMTVSFALQKLLSYGRSHLFIVAFIVCATGVLCRKWSPVPMCCRLLPTFSSIRFSVFSLILRSLIHFELSFVHGNRYGFIFILLQVDIQLC